MPIENIGQRGGVVDQRLYCPVGERIGRNRPQEIALSAVVEVMLLMWGGSPGRRRIEWSAEYA
ncbi:MAG: hypothetical protein ABFC38_01400 [Methanospirillum sp.]